MESVVLKGLALGLSTGAYCLGACVPVALPYLVSKGDSIRVSGRAVVELAAGRLVTYLLLGAGAALFGAQIQGSSVGRALVAGAMIGLAGLMFFFAVTRNFPESHACERIARWSVVRRFPFVAGLLMGVNLCPPILLCVTAIAALQSVALGLLMAACFFIGSAVFLLPLVFAGLLGRSETLKGIASVATLFCGLWFMVKGVSLLIGG